MGEIAKAKVAKKLPKVDKKPKAAKRRWVQIIVQIIGQNCTAQTFGMDDRLVNKLRVG